MSRYKIIRQQAQQRRHPRPEGNARTTRLNKPHLRDVEISLNIGYARAARLLDELQGIGIVAPADGAKPRGVNFKEYKDYTSCKDGSSPDAKKDEEEDFRRYVLPKVKLESITFEAKVWEIHFSHHQP